MSLIIGPILKLWHATDDVWTISVLVGIAGNTVPSLIYNNNQSPLEIKQLYSLNDNHIYRFILNIPLGDKTQEIHYKINETQYSFYVPPKGETPKIAFTSCNGFSSTKEYRRFMRNEKIKNALWHDLKDKHQKNPYHLLLMGGDQIYADKIWYDIFSQEDGMEKWFTLTQNERIQQEFTSEMHKKTEEFYFTHYCQSWKEEHIKDVLASIPTIMMWDDHDIFDGWGSYSKEDQECNIFQGIFKYARLFYKIFQHHLAESEEPTHITEKSSFIPATKKSSFINVEEHFSCGYKLGNILLLALDMRSERSQNNVIQDISWHEIYEWLDKQFSEDDKSLRHLFVLSALPLIHADFSVGEKIASLTKEDYLDDLYDHWSSRSHQGERSRLLYRLYNLSLDYKVQVSILSGDVHLATYGKIFNKNDVQKSFINQLTSSGIVHPSPAWWELFIVDSFIHKEQNIDAIFCGTMGPFPQAGDKKFIAERNYLSLEPSENKDNVIWANWIIEGEEKQPYTLPIHPIKTVSVKETQADITPSQ